MSAAHCVYLQCVRQRLQFQELLQQFALNSGVQGVNKHKQLGLVVSRVPGESEELCRAGNCAWLVLGAKDCALGEKIE